MAVWMNKDFSSQEEELKYNGLAWILNVSMCACHGPFIPFECYISLYASKAFNLLGLPQFA
jgi:hypothetical protein